MAEAADAALAVHDHNAAPALVEALRDTTDALAFLVTHPTMRIPNLAEHALVKARAALAKAEGKEG